MRARISRDVSKVGASHGKDSRGSPMGARKLKFSLDIARAGILMIYKTCAHRVKTLAHMRARISRDVLKVDANRGKDSCGFPMAPIALKFSLDTARA